MTSKNTNECCYMLFDDAPIIVTCQPCQMPPRVTDVAHSSFPPTCRLSQTNHRLASPGPHFSLLDSTPNSKQQTWTENSVLQWLCCTFLWRLPPVLGQIIRYWKMHVTGVGWQQQFLLALRRAPFLSTLRIHWTPRLRKRIHFLHPQLCGSSATFLFLLSVFLLGNYAKKLLSKFSIFTVKLFE